MRKMSKKPNHSTEGKTDSESVNRRLDALIRILPEIHLDKNDKFNLTAAIKAMKSSGLDRKDIAGILGKKPSDIDPLLYSKNNKKNKSKQSDKEVETRLEE